MLKVLCEEVTYVHHKLSVGCTTWEKKLHCDYLAEIAIAIIFTVKKCDDVIFIEAFIWRIKSLGQVICSTTELFSHTLFQKISISVKLR